MNIEIRLSSHLFLPDPPVKPARLRRSGLSTTRLDVTFRQVRPALAFLINLQEDQLSFTMQNNLIGWSVCTMQ